MSLDNLSGLVDSATTAAENAASSVSEFLSQGPANALSAIGNAVSGLLNSLGTAFKPLPGVKLPLANPLFAYATYDYVLGIACLTDDQLNNPDGGYMSGTKPLPLICKSANADPKNRVQIAFGQFDYFIDKLMIDSTIGLEKGANTNMHKITFQITEPLSMGTFMMSLQQAAWNSNHDNYLQAPFLLTMDFRGNTETGRMDLIPGCSRKIPFKFKDISMTVTEAGSVYQCEGYPWSSAALSSHTSEMKTDTSVKGTTVQEVLQTGEKSLQVAMNKRLQLLKKDNVVKVPDQIVIMFPTDVSSAGANSSNNGDDESNAGATTQSDAATIDSVAKQLGLVKSKIPANNTYVQDPANVNDIGKAKMGFSDTRKGDAPVGKDQKVIVNGNTVRGNNTVDPTTSDLRFSQNTDITAAIDAVLLNSDYATTQLQEKNVDDKGQRKWWRVDTQVFNITDNDSNADSTNQKPRIIVYRIVPYGVHTSKVTVPGGKAPGFEQLKKEAVKEYNFIYTGKNIDVLNFQIEVKTGFTGKMNATSAKRTQDNQQQASASGAESNDKNNEKPLDGGTKTEKKLGIQPQSVNYTSTGTGKQMGGGLETEATQAAKQFHDAITSAASMTQLSMKIIGDPYWIAQSGMGNYTSVPSQFQNLNNDGTVNYQNGEVDVMVNFRTPVDLNQTTGMYDFGKNAKDVPLLQWSGLYQVTKVVSNFDGGSFTQTLTGPRRNGQEVTGEGSTKSTLNTSNEKADSAPVNKDPTT